VVCGQSAPWSSESCPIGPAVADVADVRGDEEMTPDAAYEEIVL
jgi:hypothetical protein